MNDVKVPHSWTSNPSAYAAKEAIVRNDNINIFFFISPPLLRFEDHDIVISTAGKLADD
jgi:hypothetical protein